MSLLPKMHVKINQTLHKAQCQLVSPEQAKSLMTGITLLRKADCEMKCWF